MKVIKFVIVCACAAIAAACNDVEMERLLKDNYPASESVYENNHVLMVVMDGVSGTALQKAMNDGKAPYMKELREISNYTLNGLAETNERVTPSTAITGDRGWANLMTGISTHGIGMEGKTLEDLEAPSFMDRLLEKKPEMNVSLYAADESFYRAFSRQGMTAPVVTDDAMAKQQLLAELGEETPSRLIVAEWKGVREAGNASGFYNGSDPTQAVVDAVGVLDGYVQELMVALQQRPKYKHENWLVVLTSNYGGDVEEDIHTTNRYENVTAHTFAIIYNPRLAKNVQIMPDANAVKYNYSTPKWSFDYANWGTGFAVANGYTERATLQRNDLFTFDDGGKWGKSYTIQFLLRLSDKTANGLKVPVLSRMESITAGTGASNHGWAAIMNNSQNPRLYAQDHSKIRGAFNGANVMRDYEWHLVSIVFEPKSGSNKDVITIYTDGVKGTSVTAGWRDCMSYTGKPLTICGDICSVDKFEPKFIANAWFEVTNIQLYDVALPAKTMIEYGGRPWLEKETDYEYMDNLIAYWPCNREEDFGLSRLKDYSKYAPGDGSTDFVIEGTPFYVSGISEASDIVKPPLESDVTFYHQCYNSVDLPYEMLQWLGCSIDIDWKLEGQGWVLKQTGINE